MRLNQSPTFVAAALASIITVMGLQGCGGQFMTPPAAMIGDANLTVTVRIEGQGRFPRGSTITITLADISSFVPSPLAGDRLTLTEADRSVRITLPADLGKIAHCEKPGTCGIYVRITEGGQTLYSNSTPSPYSAGQKTVAVSVSAS